MFRALFMRKTGATNNMSKLVNRLFYTRLGQIFISLLFGVALALMFHRVCKDQKCIIYISPPTKDFKDKTFKVDEKCYQYTPEIVPCDEEGK